MTDYTMRLDVRAWQVAPDGSLPDGPEWGDRIQWAGWKIVRPILRPGDWIVKTPYGLEAMTDEAFRACCTEVAGAS